MLAQRTELAELRSLRRAPHNMKPKTANTALHQKDSKAKLSEIWKAEAATNSVDSLCSATLDLPPKSNNVSLLHRFQNRS